MATYGMATHGGAAPAGAMKSYQTPDNFTDEVHTVINHMRRLLTASTMQEHFDAMNMLDDRVIWDGPFVYTEDRDKLRVLEYFGKIFATARLEPQMAAISTSQRGRVMLEAFMNYKWMPRRNLLLWWNYLLPRFFNMNMDWDMELSEKDKISRVRSRVHNWPTLPAFMRQLATWMVAQPLVWTEPIWSQLVHFMGDYTYQREWERAQGFGYREGLGRKEGYEHGGYGTTGYGTAGMTGTTGTTGYGGTTGGMGTGGMGYGATTGTGTGGWGSSGTGGTTAGTTGTTAGTTGTTGSHVRGTGHGSTL